GRCRQPALRRVAELLGTVADADVLEGAVEHHLLRGGGRAAVGSGLAGRGAAAQCAGRALPRAVPHRAVRAGGDHPGRGGGDLALPVPHQLRPGELGAGPGRHQPGGLAGRSTLGDADHHPVRGVEELRLQHGDLPRRAAGHPAPPVRGRAHRRRLALAAVPPHHPPAAGAGAAGGGRDHRVRLFPAVRRALCDDPRRSAAEHGQRAVFHVRGRLQVVEPRPCLGRGLPAVRGHPGGDHADAAPGPAAGDGMSAGQSIGREVGQSRLHALLVNGALLLLAVISLAPLLWMVSVSFMPTGEAASFPPPLLPSAVTADNYHALFSRTGMGRNFVNSLLVAGAITLGSLLVNTLAGYAFAKLRFRGRERMFQLLLAALVVPAQVAMRPLFLLMKQLGLVNTYGGVVIPALASVFGIFLVRQYARSIPDELLEA